MIPFNRALFDVVILPGLKEAPPGQISEEVRAGIIAFATTEPDTLQIYLFLDALSKLPLTEISSFVWVLCDVRRFYLEPRSS